MNAFGPVSGRYETFSCIEMRVLSSSRIGLKVSIFCVAYLMIFALGFSSNSASGLSGCCLKGGFNVGKSSSMTGTSGG
jgi:hypothetical protein